MPALSFASRPRQRRAAALALVALLLGTTLPLTPSPAIVAVVQATPTTRYVGPGDGSDSDSSCASPTYATTSYASAQLAIQDAIDHSASGDTVRICAGTYDLTGALTVPGPTSAALTIRGDLSTNTVLRRSVGAGGSFSLIETTAGLTVGALTLSGGRKPTWPGGGAISAESGLTLSFVQLVDNRALVGGAVVVWGDLTVGDSLISDNRALDADLGRGGAIIAGRDPGSYGTPPVTVSISRSIFEHNYSPVGGGGIWAEGTIGIAESVFTDNHADLQGGGAGATLGLHVTDSHFADHTTGARFISTSYYYLGGGSALWSYGPIGIERSSFHDNTSGSAVYSYDAVSVTDGEFVGNRGWDGGAIFTWIRDEATVTVTGGSFTGNAAESGGAIRGGSGVFVRGTRFTENTARTGNAGAVVALGALGVTDATFVRNAAVAGGAISPSIGSATVIDGSTFLDNSAQTGGAIYANDGFLVRGSAFVGNHATGDGGAVYGDRVRIVSSTFVDNTAGIDGGSSSGGGAYAYTSLEVSGSTFVDNMAGSVDYLTGAPNAGHLYQLSMGSPVVRGSIFSTTGDGAGGCGSSVFTGSHNLTTDATCPGTLTTGDALALEPLADNGGPSPTIALNRASVAINAGGAVPCSTATDQRGRVRDGLCDIGAYEYSPVVYVGDGRTSSPVSECASPDDQLDHYPAPQDAITNAIRRMPETTIVHLCAGTYALTERAIADSGENLILEGDGSTSTIIEPAAGSIDFPLLQLGDDPTDSFFSTDVSGVTFRRARNESYPGQGGAIAAATNHSGGLTVASASFEDCRAYEGGAIYLTTGALGITDGTRFVGNLSAIEGGAIRTGGFTLVRNALFADNTAGNGGAIFASPGQLMLSGGTFERNVARNNGGAIGGNEVAIVGGRYEGNVATDDGGALIAATITIDGASFRHGRAGGSGGAVYSYSYLDVSASTFIENSAGSALTDGYGGAIAATGSFWVHQSLFARNSSTRYGGAVSVLPGGGSLGFASIAASTFVENTAGSQGGALYLPLPYPSGSPLLVTGSTFVDNSAGTSGYAVIRALRSVFITGDLFVGNGGCDTTPADAGGNVRAGTTCPGESTTRAALRLGTLGDHGGPTWTVPLGLGSPAIDPTTGSDTCSEEFDQRGEPRPALVRCDAGAYEFQPDDPADPYEHETAIRIVATLNGSEITAGTVVTTGDRIVVRAWVESSTLTDVTQGVVALRACNGSFSLPSDCQPGYGNELDWASVTDGTSGSDGLGEATIPSWTPPGGTGYYRLGATYRVAGGRIADSDISVGGPSFRVIQSIRIVWDPTAGSTVVAAGVTIPVRASVLGAGGLPVTGCPIGFNLADGTVVATTASSGVASVTLPAQVTGLTAVTVTTGDGCVAAIPAYGVIAVGSTVFPKGTVGSVGAGWYYLSGSTGTRASFGYRIEQTTGTSGKGKTAVTTRTTRYSLVWVTSTGWAVGVVNGLEVTTGASVWQRPTCPTSASDGAGVSVALGRSTLCGRVTAQGIAVQLTPGNSPIPQVTFSASIIDGGTAKTGDLTDWFGMTSVLNGGTPVSGLPVHDARPTRFSYAGSVRAFGRILVY